MKQEICPFLIHDCFHRDEWDKTKMTTSGKNIDNFLLPY